VFGIKLHPNDREKKGDCAGDVALAIGFESHPPHYTLKKALETVTKVDDFSIVVRRVCAGLFQHLLASVPKF
jgi:hypothetical protein